MDQKDRKTEYHGDIDIEKATEGLSVLERAILGSILGASEGMSADILGVRIDELIDILPKNEDGSDVTKRDVAVALDIIQKVEFVIPNGDDGGVFRANIIVVIGYTEDADGEIQSVVLASPARFGS